jgi:hypothetical protein
VRDFIFGIEKKQVKFFRASTSKFPTAKSLKHVQIIGCVLAAVLVVVWISLERYTSIKAKANLWSGRCAPVILVPGRCVYKCYHYQYFSRRKISGMQRHDIKRTCEKKVLAFAYLLENPHASYHIHNPELSQLSHTLSLSS